MHTSCSKHDVGVTDETPCCASGILGPALNCKHDVGVTDETPGCTSGKPGPALNMM